MIKTRIFIDFWNFQLTLNESTNSKFPVDWEKISPWLVSEASKHLNKNLEFEGTRVYLSYNLKSPNYNNFIYWVDNILSRFTGIEVVKKERKPKNNPKCQSCLKEITECPHCGEKIHRTIEKGIDTAIVTDLFSLAWEDAWQVAILVSSDKDFIPAVNTLSSKGFKIINAHFPPTGMELARTCWANIDLKKGLNKYKRRVIKKK